VNTIIIPIALLFGADGAVEDHTMPRDRFAFIRLGTGLESAHGTLGGPGDGSFDVLDTFTMNYN
jgi:hypothetical protein